MYSILDILQRSVKQSNFFNHVRKVRSRFMWFAPNQKYLQSCVKCFCAYFKGHSLSKLFDIITKVGEHQSLCLTLFYFWSFSKEVKRAFQGMAKRRCSRSREGAIHSMPAILYVTWRHEQQRGLSAPAFGAPRKPVLSFRRNSVYHMDDIPESHSFFSPSTFSNFGVFLRSISTL